MQAVMGKGRITSTAVGVVLVAAMAGGIAQPVSPTSSSESEPPQAVEERIRVAESAVLVRAPARHLMGLPILRPPTVRELAVYVGEELLEVTEVRGLEGDETWSVVIYLDAPLTNRETLSRSALALARAAETLSARGPVELLLAASKGAPRLLPSRTPRALESSLADIVLQADDGELGGELAALRRESLIARNRAEQSGSDPDAAMSALVRRQTEALSHAVRDRCRTDICLLLLVSEGFPERLPSAAGGGDSETPSAPKLSCCAEEDRRLARELAAARWIVGAVAMQMVAGKVGASRDRPPEARQLDAGIPPDQQSRNAAMVPSRYSREIAIEKLNLVLRLDSSILKRMVRETGGFLAATPSELMDSVRALDERLLVWFRHPQDPPDRALPLRIVFVPRSQELWAPRWWRALPDDRRSDRAIGE